MGESKNQESEDQILSGSQSSQGTLVLLVKIEIRDLLPLLVFKNLLLRISFYNENIAFLVFLEAYRKENLRCRIEMKVIYVGEQICHHYKEVVFKIDVLTAFSCLFDYWIIF